MSSVTQVSQQLQSILEERANELARETGCIKRERKFSGADVVQTLVFGWQQHPDASLEQLASTAEVHPGVGHRHGSAQALHAGVRAVLACGVGGDDEPGGASHQ
jgi:hypothetical protein